MARTDAVLADTNPLLDVVTPPNAWADWFEDAMRQAARTAALWVDDGIFAQRSIAVEQEAEVEAALRALGIMPVPTLRPALFRAGTACRDHRRRGGARTGILPDVFVGAHTGVAELRPITRDLARDRTHVPDLTLIAPG